MQQIKFDKWIKARIGEPLTAFDVDEKMIVFGSISGYIGCFNYAQNELKYIPDVFEEIIRGVTIQKEKVYIIIGDQSSLIFDYQMNDSLQYKFDRPHSAPICCSTLSLCHQHHVLLLSVAPTQNKDIGVDISTKKNSIYMYNLDSRDPSTFYVDMPNLQVPFDFDGNQMLMLEYLKDAKKKLSILTLNQEPKIITILEIDPKIEYISHGKFIPNGILYVENHKIIKSFDINAKSSKIIKITKQQIMSLDYFENKITILEYDGTITLLENENQILQFNFTKINQMPLDLIKHKYLFDMGYPYYIKRRANKIVFTHDLGMMALSLVL